jgi:hypothetical protein
VNHLVAFHHEDAQLGVFDGTLERAIGRKRGLVERGNFFNAEHPGDFARPSAKGQPANRQERRGGRQVLETLRELPRCRRELLGPAGELF